MRTRTAGGRRSRARPAAPATAPRRLSTRTAPPLHEDLDVGDAGRAAGRMPAQLALRMGDVRRRALSPRADLEGGHARRSQRHRPRSRRGPAPGPRRSGPCSRAVIGGAAAAALASVACVAAGRPSESRPAQGLAAGRHRRQKLPALVGPPLSGPPLRLRRQAQAGRRPGRRGRHSPAGASESQRARRVRGRGPAQSAGLGARRRSAPRAAIRSAAARA